MRVNSRLTVAAHILAMVAHIERDQNRAATSDELAKSIGTNPVVVRRVLVQLKKARLVDRRRGVGGGMVLARDPRTINLRQAYEAVESAEAELLGRHAGDVGEECSVAPFIAEYLDEIYDDAEKALLERLAKVSVDEMARTIVDRMRRRGALHKHPGAC
ncbi:Rrf2 family transcriptional regulator [soil metagenome]